MTTLSFNDLPGQSHFSSALASNDTWLHHRLGGTKRVHEFSKEKRNAAVAAIRKTMSNVQLSVAQESALTKMEVGTNVIVTGQQVGFLGGPLYTVYKIATALSRVREIQESGQTAIAVFWIEDNDHDAIEASTAFGFTKEQGVMEWSCYAAESNDKIPVADRMFSTEIEGIVTALSLTFGHGEFGAETTELLMQAYAAGKSWTSSFVHLLQSWFADSGLLIIGAALARSLQMMTPVIQQELENPGKLEEAVNEANVELAEHGFHAQAKASELNVFFHQNGQRVKIHRDDTSGEIVIGNDRMTHQELMTLFSEQPQNFSPSVLLRPIVQDDILGTLEYVAGPSEAAYIAQLNGSYAFFDVAMPRVVLRSGATLISKRIQKFLDKENLSLQTFLRPWEVIEQELTTSLRDADSTAMIDTTRTAMSELVEAIRTSVTNVDKTLDGSVSAAWKAIEKELDGIRKKVNSASKRKEEEKISKFREANAFLYPLGELQERKLSPIFVNSEGGTSAIQQIIETIASQPASQHFVLNI